MGNVITDRVSFFLKDYPPFQFLTQDVLDTLACNITVKFLPKNAFLFEENHENTGVGYMVRQGNIILFRKKNTETELIDQCDKGDILGIRSLLSGNHYVMSAQASEDSLLYLIEKKDFDHLMQTHPKFSLFFLNGYAAGQIIVKPEKTRPLFTTPKFFNEKLEYATQVLTCQEDIPIVKAAQLMKERNIGSIIIADPHSYPLGIVTDTDLRNKVVAQAIPSHTPISQIMSAPVLTVVPTISLAEALSEMIQNKVHHLIVTEKGTPKSKIVGIISDHDVVYSQKNHPAALIKSIKYSHDIKKWAEIRAHADKMLTHYFENEVSIKLISNLITQLNDTIITKALDRALTEYPEAKKISFCWLSLGSEGRKEQLLRTDQDNAIVFTDEGNAEENQKTLLKIAHRVNEILALCGFEKCPAEIMANNPKYCQSITEWQKYFEKWINSPTPQSVLNATIFFDFRPTYGHFKWAEKLETFLMKQLQSKSMFLHFMAQNAIQNPPPLSFFRNFLVERSGEHKNEFDIKKRAMMPLSDAARLLSLQYGIKEKRNTQERWEAISTHDSQNASLYEQAKQAYELFLKLRTQSGLKYHNSGRFINLDDLNKLQRQMLKNSFSTLNEIQNVLKIRFQLSYFN